MISFSQDREDSNYDKKTGKWWRFWDLVRFLSETAYICSVVMIVENAFQFGIESADTGEGNECRRVHLLMVLSREYLPKIWKMLQTLLKEKIFEEDIVCVVMIVWKNSIWKSLIRWTQCAMRRIILWNVCLFIYWRGSIAQTVWQILAHKVSLNFYC